MINAVAKDTSDCDYICFIGIAPNAIFMRLENIKEIDFSKLHNRGHRGTGAGYKCDFKSSQMQEVKTREEVVSLFYNKMGLDKDSIKKILKNK